MKNSELYTIIYGQGWYHAKSNLTGWASRSYRDESGAVKDGEAHARILKAIYPQLNDTLKSDTDDLIRMIHQNPVQSSSSKGGV